MALINGLTDVSVRLTALAAAPLVFQAADTIDLWFQSQSQSRRTVIAKLVSLSLSSGAKIGLILVRAPLLAFAAVILLDVAISAIAISIAYRLHPTNGRWRVLSRKARDILRESWPYLLSGFSIIIYIRVDQIMLKQISGAGDLGIFAAAIGISQTWNIIPMTLATSFAPFVTRKRAESQSAYFDTLVTLFRSFGIIALLVSTTTALAAPLIIALLYGKSYAAASPVLMIHVFSNVFIYQGVAQQLWLINEGRARLSLVQTGAGGLISIAMNLALIPAFSAIGAAISALVSCFISSIGLNYFLARDLFWMQLGFRPSRLLPDSR